MRPLLKDGQTGLTSTEREREMKNLASTLTASLVAGFVGLQSLNPAVAQTPPPLDDLMDNPDDLVQTLALVEQGLERKYPDGSRPSTHLDIYGLFTSLARDGWLGEDWQSRYNMLGSLLGNKFGDDLDPNWSEEHKLSPKRIEVWTAILTEQGYDMSRERVEEIRTRAIRGMLNKYGDDLDADWDEGITPAQLRAKLDSLRKQGYDTSPEVYQALYEKTRRGMLNKYGDDLDPNWADGLTPKVLRDKLRALRKEGYDMPRHDYLTLYYRVRTGMQNKYGDGFDPNWGEGMSPNKLREKRNALREQGHLR